MKSVESIQFPNHGGDIGIGSRGVFRKAVFTGSFKRAKFRHYDYMTITITNEDYDSNGHHRFYYESEDGQRSWVRGKNLYPNYHETESATQTALNNKHDRAAESKLLLGRSF